MNDNIQGRIPSPNLPEASHVSNAALLVDFDNVTMGIRSDLQSQLRLLLNSEIIKGKVSVQRAYADWRRYPQYIAPLAEASIDLIFAPAFGSNKKNATDIRLAIDALELVFTRPEIGTFILLSGDSDFSSLVLKLKEYGKWVIGVGIRASASDLLVQNCDEYYSYSELTGFAKEGEVASAQKDPWELVVQAVVRMRDGNDVMRSDRLKQVMQQIDPHFDEKDSGFNRFSKFVLEAGRRGLVELAKLESGQFSIGLGADANVLPEQVPDDGGLGEATAPQTPKKPERSVVHATGVSGLTLAGAFDLLTRSLVDLGAVGEETADVEQARERTMALSEEESDAVFEPSRFKQLVGQARDAGLLEILSVDNIDLVRLTPRAIAPSDEPSATPQRARRKRTTKKKKTTRKSQVPSTEAVEISAVTATQVEEQPDEEKPKRRARRTKSRGEASAKMKVEDKSVEVVKPPVAEVAAPAEPDSMPAPESDSELPDVAQAVRRSLRGRGSSRSRKKSESSEAPTETPAALPSKPDVTAPTSESQAIGGAPPARVSLRGRGSSRQRRQPVPKVADSTVGESTGHEADTKSEEAKPRSSDRGAARGRSQRGRKPARRNDSSTARDNREPRHGEKPDTQSSDRATRGGRAPRSEAKSESGGQRRSRPGAGRDSSGSPRAAGEQRPTSTRGQARRSPPQGRGQGARRGNRRPESRTEKQVKPSTTNVQKLDAPTTEGGLFKRMTVAFQRAIRGDDSKP